MRGAYAAAALTGVQVGAALVASAAVVAEVGAGRLGFLRYALALLLLLPFVWRAQRQAARPGNASAPIARSDWLPVLLLGAGQFGLLIALLNWAVVWTDPARVSLVFATLPLVALVVGHGLGQPAPGRRELAALLLTLLGVAVLLGSEAWSGALGWTDLLGLAAAAGATLIGALCSVLYRPYLQRYGVLKISALAMSAALVPLGAMAWLEAPAASPTQWSLLVWALIGFIGLSSALGYLLWLYALRHLPAARVTAFLALSPLTATVLGVGLGLATVSWALAASLLCVATGLAVVGRLGRSPVC